jgi:hypothetical protein
MTPPADMRTGAPFPSRDGFLYFVRLLTKFGSRVRAGASGQGRRPLSDRILDSVVADSGNGHIVPQSGFPQNLRSASSYSLVFLKRSIRMAGESEFRLCLMGGRRRSALTPQSNFKVKLL